ncbi:MAG: hypothetical protein ACI9GM_001674 [Salibacteraceae bacterium]
MYKIRVSHRDLCVICSVLGFVLLEYLPANQK